MPPPAIKTKSSQSNFKQIFKDPFFDRTVLLRSSPFEQIVESLEKYVHYAVIHDHSRPFVAKN